MGGRSGGRSTLHHHSGHLGQIPVRLLCARRYGDFKQCTTYWIRAKNLLLIEGKGIY